jgi:hypothetical protein
MISRKTAIAIGNIFEEKFTHYNRYNNRNPFTLYSDQFYDFLFEHNYEAWFCNKAQQISHRPRRIKELIMKFHTGESVYDVTPTWNWDQRRLLGQQYLHNMAQDILVYNNGEGVYISDKTKAMIEDLLSNLELDGYIFRENHLLKPESDVLEIEEEEGILTTLYKSLNLENFETTFHHLKLSEEHYLAGRWDDTISNSRKFFESVLREVANIHSQKSRGTKLSLSIYDSPRNVRDYLKNEGLLEEKEKEAISKIYGILSNTGGHPYMAKNDQARLLRQTALIFSQFIMLRLDGYFKS